MTLLPSDLLWLASRAKPEPPKPDHRTLPRISAKRRRFGFYKTRKTA